MIKPLFAVGEADPGAHRDEKLHGFHSRDTDAVEDKSIEQVVMGTRGAGAVANMLLGSVATKVLHLVEVPVLLVK